MTLNHTLRQLTRYGLFLWASLSLHNAAAFDLQSAQVSIAGPHTLYIQNLTHNGKLYNLEVEFHGDGRYSISENNPRSASKAAQYNGGSDDSTGGGSNGGSSSGIDFSTGYVRVVSANALRLFEIQANGRKVNVTLSSTQLGYWTASQMSDAFFNVSTTGIDSTSGIWQALHTCRGADMSPPMEWYGAPDGTITYAIVMDDPQAQDSSGQSFVHWNAYNIPASMHKLVVGQSNSSSMPVNSLETENSFGNIGYNGPCPTGSQHRYYLRVYALNSDLSTGSIPTGPISRAEFEKRFSGYILSWAEVFGDYGP